MAAKSLCTIEGCGKPVVGRGFCNKHYRRLMKNGNPLVSQIDREQTGQPCKVEGCENLSGRHGYCVKHYARIKRTGDASVASLSSKYRRVERWLNDHVQHSGDDCLIWPFSSGPNGRGTATVNGRQTSTPNAMCTLAHGRAPTIRHEAAHSCGNGHLGCVNPRHLRWATATENESDKRRHGTIRMGRQINTVKLTEMQVREIREIGTAISAKVLALRYGVHKTTIYDIRNRSSWGWLE